MPAFLQHGVYGTGNAHAERKRLRRATDSNGFSSLKDRAYERCHLLELAHGPILDAFIVGRSGADANGTVPQRD